MVVARWAGAWALLGALLGGCASTPPQMPVALSPQAVAAGGGRIGVTMTTLPKVDTSFPGAVCLLCLAAASVANGDVTTFAKTLPHEDLPKLAQAVAARLQRKGADVVLLEGDLKLDKLPPTGSKVPNATTVDFTSLKSKYGIDRLLVIEIRLLGFERTYAAYVPTSDPKAVFRGRGYIVDLASNTYVWYMPVSILRSSDGPWDEPPKFPGLSNAYFQTIELGRDAFLEPFDK